MNVPQIIEKTREYGKTVYLCFLDYSKSFDCVNWRRLWDVLSQMGTLRHLIHLLKEVYNNNITLMKVDERTSEPFNVERGVLIV